MGTSNNEQAQSEAMVFSVDSLVATFRHIDRQIQKLHRCSSDDFLGLNAKFKGFYKEAKGISTSAGALFLLFSEGANRKLIAELEDFYETLVRSKRQLQQLLDTSLDILQALRATSSALFLPFRNLAQNGSTLSLLLANISLGYAAKLRANGHTPEALATTTTGIDEFVTQCHLAIRKSQKLSQSLDEAQKSIQNIRDNTLHNLDNVMADVHFGLILFAEKHEEAQTRIPQITSKTESCSKSIAGIITNLQYQDIIRQKMEHIQQAHQELMGELEATRENGGEESERWTHMLVQIRDISALQSAQLVGTNREYQTAIELIAKHFRDVASDMENVATLCYESLCASTDSGSSSAVTDLLKRLKGSGRTLGSLTSNVPELRSDLSTLAELLTDLTEQGDLRVTLYNQTDEAISKLLNSTKAGEGEENLAEVLAQLSSVSNDLHAFHEATIPLVESMESERRSLLKQVENLDVEMPVWARFEKGAQRMHAIAEDLAHTERESTQLLAHIQEMSRKVSTDTHQALEGIQYYDFFARIIGDITASLNAMSATIKQTVDDSMTADMHRVRSWYTMASEHRIHDHFEDKSQGNVDLFEGGLVDENDIEQNEEDGLELF